MQTINNIEDNQSEIIHKNSLSRMNEGNNTSDYFLVQSQAIDNNPEIKELRKKIRHMLQQKNLMKVIFEEQIFKLKQEYQNLRFSFTEFVMKILQEFKTSKNTKLQMIKIQNSLQQKQITKLKQQMTSILKSNEVLKYKNDQMTSQIQRLKTSIQIKKLSYNRSSDIMKIQYQSNLFAEQFKDKQRISCFNDDQRIKKMKRYESSESFYLKTNPQQIKAQSHFKIQMQKRGNMISPIKKRSSYICSEMIQQYNNNLSLLQNDIYKPKPQRYQSIPQQQKKNIITRKPGIMTNKYPRKSINFQQLQLRINSIRNQLRSQIRSVQKRRVDQKT